MEKKEFDDIVELFRCTQTLPRLPEPAIHLIELIDRGHPSCHDLEMVIMGDPPLAAAILRSASSAAYASATPVTTISSAIVRLGLRSVRTLALTFAMQAMLGRSTESNHYDSARFARHSVFVAICSQYLYENATAELGIPTVWNPDEVFAVGLLHDLSACLLAQVAPELYDKAWTMAKARDISLSAQFQSSFNEKMPVLGRAAACAWRLPELFVNAMDYLADTPVDPAGALCHDVLIYADALAVETGFAHEPWLTEHDPLDIKSAILLPDDERADTIAAIAKHCDEFLAAAHGV